MDRKEFVSLAQRTSTLSESVLGIKKDVPLKLQVKHNNILYYPVAYQIGFSKGQPLHTAILHDLKSNSVIYAQLDQVESALI